MKRLLVHILVFSFALPAAWAEGGEVASNAAKTVVTKATEMKARTEQAAGKEQAASPLTLKTYSMNSLLFVETNSEHPVSVLTADGKLEREVSPTGVLMAIPVSRGTYTVKTGNLSERVVVK
ncbi:hypothetical protein [Parabacteroides sp. PF5-6]|uniref:hypothetical protein n=1 Tax=Parabacteroides sp. PF5-6 TaxID=1742403 RepID=UPI00240763C8|nr:hypothetical protein [Parabacteroides sp. PF5-6]MDF9830058.1 hypothetical protein [Parabacteroides sp. PF5-6]